MTGTATGGHWTVDIISPDRTLHCAMVQDLLALSRTADPTDLVRL